MANTNRYRNDDVCGSADAGVSGHSAQAPASAPAPPQAQAYVQTQMRARLEGQALVSFTKEVSSSTAPKQAQLVPSTATSGFFQTFPLIQPQYTSLTAKLDRGSDAATISAQNSGNVRRITSLAGHNDLSTTQHELCGDDVALHRVLALYLPRPLPRFVDEHLHDLARICIAPSTSRLVVDAELTLPSLHPLNTFGLTNEVDALRVGEGWRGLKDIGIRVGSVALGYGIPTTTTATDASQRSRDGDYARWNRRVHQFATNHLWTPSSALVTCPAAMSDGAAVLLGKHLNDADQDQPGRAAVLAEAKRRLVSFDPAYAWTSGQWMTERSGGSDVSGTETTAIRLGSDELQAEGLQNGCDVDHVGMQLGPWKVDGSKWFSSATDADMVVLLARTANGISVFYAPMRRRRGDEVVMNGVRITRLKQKLGTKALPTSELEIKGMRAWLVGEEGKGIKEISAILNTTRLWTAAGAVGGWARGLAVARAYSSVRKVKGKLLVDNPQHVHWMSNEVVKYQAALHLVFLGAALNGIAEQGIEACSGTRAASFLPSDKADAERLLRVLTPVMKAQCSLASVAGLRETMESLGGLGYCENNEDGGVLNLARLFRDCNVNPIWEGTVSVMAEDFVRAIKGKEHTKIFKALDGLIHGMLHQLRSTHKEQNDSLWEMWTCLLRDLQDSSQDELLYQGRSLLSRTGDLICACLLALDACVSGEATAGIVAERWLAMSSSQKKHSTMADLQSLHEMDRRIFLGQSAPEIILRAHM